jgi:hypothetical protein
MSLVCRIVKVFFIVFSSFVVASDPVPVSKIAAPAAAEPAINSRRESVSLDMTMEGFLPSAAVAGFPRRVFIVVSFQ